MEIENYSIILKKDLGVDLEKASVVGKDKEKICFISDDGRYIEINKLENTVKIDKKEYKIIGDALFEISEKYYVSVDKESIELYRKIKSLAQNKCKSVYIERKNATIVLFGSIYTVSSMNEVNINGHNAIELHDKQGETFYLMKTCAIVHKNQIPAYEQVSNILTGGYVILDDCGKPAIISKYFEVRQNSISFYKKHVKIVAKVYRAVWGKNLQKKLVNITQNYPTNNVKVFINGDNIETYWKKIKIKELFPVLKNPEHLFGTDEAYIAEIYNGIPRKILLDKRVYRFDLINEGAKIYKLSQAPIVEIYITSHAQILYKDGHTKKIYIGINDLGKRSIEQIVGENYILKDNVFYGDNCKGILYPTGSIKLMTANKACMKKFGAIGKRMIVKIDPKGQVQYMKIENPTQVADKVVNELVPYAEKIEYSEQRWNIILDNKATINYCPAKNIGTINLKDSNQIIFVPGKNDITPFLI